MCVERWEWESGLVDAGIGCVVLGLHSRCEA